jgi:Xaa-Pro aminopeptidase
MTSVVQRPGVDLTRRWSRVWADMDARGLDTLIVYGTNALSQYGNVSYLTGALTANLPGNKGTFLVVRRGKPATLVVRSPIEARALTKEATGHLELVQPAEAGRPGQLARVADLCRPGRVALAGPPHMPHTDAVALQALLGCDLPTVDLLTEARRTLTAEDHAAMRAEAQRIEQTFRYLTRYLRIGMSERDVAACIESQLVRSGSHVRIVQVCAGHFHGQAPTERLIRGGDLLTVFVESAGSGGHWVELGVIAHVGVVSSAQRNHSQLVQAALRSFRHQALPGRAVADISASVTKSLTAHGSPTIGLGHGTGVDEQPWALEMAPKSRLQCGEAVAVHPSLEPRTQPAVAAAVANTFIVGPAPAEALSQMPFTTLVLPRP